ncbi:hypothetical protein VCSRO155_1581 [Vibrio cholerae]|uniref:hypothetical protein n=1 Tax=Vibrio paracholerae TaxID=650003 RepID=UPI0004E3B608|nr:hypothetical protein [Vibrio paracholerae]KFD80055.1 hypothetical protein DA89_2608 [Vibrio paracholerae]QAV05668.1 Phage replicative DNA helicase, repA [Vibrio cholerae]GHW94827.1 hypothetical protein VCSRO155_1581 [Vibrio cholerae]
MQNDFNNTIDKFMGQLCEVDHNTTEKKTNPFNLAQVDVIAPHGILGDMCASMAKSAHRALPEAYPLYGLQVLALVAAKAGIRSFTGSKLNIITLLIAPTAAGKENGQAFFDEIASQLSLSQYCFNKPRSDKDLITNMIESEGICSYSIDEAHGLFDAMGSKNAQSYQVAMGAEMLSLATKSNYVLSGNHRREFRQKYESDLAKAQKQLNDILENDEAFNSKREDALHKKIKKLERILECIETGFKNPLINMSMASTPEKIDKVVSSESIESGLMGRSIVIRADEERRELNLNPSPELCSGDTIVALGRALSRSGNLKITPAAKELFNSIVIHFDKTMRNHPTLGGLYARIGDRALCIASLLAVASAEVTEADVRYAFALVLRHVADCKFLLTKATAAESGEYEDQLSMVNERILKFCTSEGMPLSQLKQRVCKPRDIAAAVRKAEKQGKPSIYQHALGQLVMSGALVVDNEKNQVRLANEAI